LFNASVSGSIKSSTPRSFGWTYRVLLNAANSDPQRCHCAGGFCTGADGAEVAGKGCSRGRSPSAWNWCFNANITYAVLSMPVFREPTRSISATSGGSLNI
jgi:hypothetical protein